MATLRCGDLSSSTQSWWHSERLTPWVMRVVLRLTGEPGGSLGKGGSAKGWKDRHESFDFGVAAAQLCVIRSVYAG